MFPRLLIPTILAAVLAGPICAYTPAPLSNPRDWVRHVVPLPKSIEITSSRWFEEGCTAVVAPGGNPIVLQAARELMELAGRSKGAALFTIKLQLGGPGSEPLRTLANSEQAYRIVPGANDRGLKLIALQPQGLYYASKTLGQLLAARRSKSWIEIPILEVTDWPDISDRGLWGTDSHVKLRWMADRKMNLVEQISYLEVDAQGRGHAALKDGREPMITLAPRLAMNPVPAVLHLDQVGGKGLFAAYPELRGQGGEENAMCYSKPLGIVTALSDWLVDLSKLDNVKEVDVWLSENLHGKGGCRCEECSKVDRSLMEARIVLQAWRLAQERAGKFGLRILTSEETGKSNALIMNELPEGVKLWYYHSLFTYTTGQTPMIPPEVEDYARGGGWAGAVPSLCAWVNYLEPFTGAHFIHYRMNEFVDKDLKGLLGYATPQIDFVHFNTEAAAEWSWNSKGRSPREFALSWAVREGLADPEKFAEWSETIGPVSWDVYGSDWPASEKRRWPGKAADLVRAGKLPELGVVTWGVFRGPWGDIENEVQLADNVRRAARGLQLAREMGIDEFIYESLAADGYIRALQALYSLKGLVSSEGIAQQNTGAAAAAFAAYIDGMATAAEALPKWERTVAPDSGEKLFVDASLELINGSIRQMSELAAELGVPVGAGN